MNLSDQNAENSRQSFLQDKINEKILTSRRIFLSDAIDSATAERLIREFWYLELLEPGKPILFIINSPGGSVDAGFAVWDQIKALTSPVTTLVTGLAASMGSILSLCSAEGKRFATPNARIMIHQPLIGGVIRGQATDLEIQAKEILKTRDTLVQIYTKATKKSKETIEQALDRDMWMSADEAKEFGLLDKIVTSMKEISF